jgi:hypothetical protein
MPKEFVTLFAQKDGQVLVRRHCRTVGLEVSDLKELVEEVIEKDSLQRRHGLWQFFDEKLDSIAEEEGAATAGRDDG